MFWRETKGLAGIPLVSKLTLTVLLAVAGVGYLLGFTNIYLSYSPVDQKPGMSLQDISRSFYGERGSTKLDKAIDGSMRQYFAGDAEHQAMKEWLAGGAKESEFQKVKPVFESSCNSCHSAEAAVADVVTADYADLAPLLKQDTGKSVSRLVSLSHTHVLATLPVIFVLVFIFSFARYPEALKGLVMVFSSLAILLDVGSWWLAKLSPALAILVILGGVSLAVSFLALIVLSFVDLWFGKRES
jgi:cytochrome c5